MKRTLYVLGVVVLIVVASACLAALGLRWAP